MAGRLISEGYTTPPPETTWNGGEPVFAMRHETRIHRAMSWDRTYVLTANGDWHAVSSARPLDGGA